MFQFHQWYDYKYETDLTEDLRKECFNSTNGTITRPLSCFSGGNLPCFNSTNGTITRIFLDRPGNRFSSFNSTNGTITSSLATFEKLSSRKFQFHQWYDYKYLRNPRRRIGKSVSIPPMVRLQGIPGRRHPANARQFQFHQWYDYKNRSRYVNFQRP